MGLYRWAAAESPVLHSQAGRLCRWHAASGSQEWPYAGAMVGPAMLPPLEVIWSCSLLIFLCLR